MDRSCAATVILACGVRYGRKGLATFFPSELETLLSETFAELHKNNLPEEEFLFALKRMFEDAGRELPDTFDVCDDVTVAEIHAEVRQNDHYSRDNRLETIGDFRQESVLKDFVYYLSQLFFAKPALFDVISMALS
jgi:hypothetical protein